MEIFNTIITKISTLEGKMPSFDRPEGNFTDPNTNEYHMAMISDYASHNYMNVPIIIKEAKGAHLWDVTGKKYIDFMAGHGCVNQGHCHPKILEAINEQAKKLTLMGSVTNHNVIGPTSKKLTEIFKYDKILYMNSGSEAVDAAVLTVRRWGYKKKNIPYGKASILFPRHCYWGEILSARSGATDMDRRELSEPLATEALCFGFVDYDDTEALEVKIKANPNICAFIFEPIQGHAGNIYPSPGYYRKVREICDKYNVLMVADEIQSGMGRTGRLLACDWEGVKPDVLVLGKGLGAGYMPVSAVLANNDIMDVWYSTNSHRSTYGANALACVIASTAVDILFEDHLIENADKLGKIVEEEFKKYDYSFIVKKNFGKGLFASLEFKDKLTCWTICLHMIKNGIFVIPESGGYLKMMPPLCITEEDLRYCLKVLKEGLDDFQKKGKLGLVI